MNRRSLLASFCTLGLLFIAGCATSPYQGDGKNKSDALLKQQFESAEQQRASTPAGRIIFAGLAMHSQSKAFRNDVMTVEKGIRSIDANAIVFKLDNPAFGQEADWPYATTQNIEAVLKKVAGMARPDDKVVVLMSTHGHVDVLAVNFGNTDYPHVNARVLNEWLAGLRGKPTLLLLSACYSGSFLQPLSGPSRVILAAAAKDRASFGCQLHSTNTYFIDALMNQPSLQDRSLEQLMEQAKITVDKRERDQKLSPSSLPQMSIGSAARTWAAQPLRSWVDPK